MHGGVPVAQLWYHLRAALLAVRRWRGDPTIPWANALYCALSVLLVLAQCRLWYSLRTCGFPLARLFQVIDGCTH